VAYQELGDDYFQQRQSVEHYSSSWFASSSGWATR
jgi:hypothetical protein